MAEPTGAGASDFLSHPSSPGRISLSLQTRRQWGSAGCGVRGRALTPRVGLVGVASGPPTRPDRGAHRARTAADAATYAAAPGPEMVRGEIAESRPASTP
eukprot:6205084-Pleurochrysis_carterae.AAC.1